MLTLVYLEKIRTGAMLTPADSNLIDITGRTSQIEDLSLDTARGIFLLSVDKKHALSAYALKALEIRGGRVIAVLFQSLLCALFLFGLLRWRIFQ